MNYFFRENEFVRPHRVGDMSTAITTGIMKENTPDPSALFVVELSAANKNIKLLIKYYFINLCHISSLSFMPL